MSNLSKSCSVCISNKSVLIRITSSDANQMKWSSKLKKCVPEVAWGDDCCICLNCIENLEIAYTFYNLCLQSYEMRKPKECMLKIESDDIPDLLCFKEDEIQSAINEVNWVPPNIDVEETPQNDIKEIMDIKIEEFCTDENEPDSCINRNSSDEEYLPEIAQAASSAPLDGLPVKSRHIYQRAYGEFQQWAKKNQADPKCISEKILMEYFLELSKVQKSPSLWSKFSMLKSTLMVNDNIDIKKFSKLISFLKRKAHGYKPKKSKLFTRQDIVRFLKEAPDELYLMKKVVLIIGIAGSCRLEELVFLETDNIQDMGSVLLIAVRESTTKIQRSFAVIKSQESRFPDMLAICRKYMNLRQPHTPHKRLFVNYQKGKCTTQVVGINTIGKVPRQVAEYLKLSEPTTYTAHSLRRTSATMLAP